MKLKELKDFVSSLPKDSDDKKVVFSHLNSGYPSEYEITGYFMSKKDDEEIVVLTDISVVPRV